MKKFLALVLSLCLMMTALPIVSLAEDTYREPITLTVFSQLANFAGEQSGWFAKELKDRFNVTINFVSTNVDSNAFNASVESGYMGDIVNLGNTGGDLTTLLNAGLLFDWDEVDLTPYPNISTYLTDAFATISSITEAQGFTGKYGFAFGVAMESGAWAELTDPTYALQIRFDAWEKAGKPALTSLEDLPDFLQALQDAVPTNENGDKVYAYGGFPEWEDCVMKFTWDLMTFYGYKEADFMGVNYATGEVVNPLEEGSLYYRALKVNNELYRRGLFDPESVSQTFDSYSQKLTAGRYLMALWGWIINNYNSAEKAANKDGFVTFMFEDSAPQQLTASTSGGSDRMWALGADCVDVDRCLEIIEWLCTEEGLLVQSYGPKGLCWDYGEDGVPYMTDFGWACQEDKANTVMPDEYGGGTFQDGESKFNHETIKLEQMIPGKTYSFSYKGWPCYADRYATALSEAWSTEYANGATSGIELYRNAKVSVVPDIAIAWTYPEMSDSAKEARALFAPEMKNGSWKCVMAETEEEFEATWQQMVSTCKQYGYDEYVAEKMEAINQCFADCGITPAQ